MASHRHLSRIAIMQTIFEYEFQLTLEKADQTKENDPKTMLAYNITQLAKKVEDTSFALDTIKGVFKHRDEIFEIIQKYAPQWPIEKIAPVDRAILEVGVYEIVYNDDIPPIVAINEAVEIAKVYGDDNSPKFVNGVLSTVMSEHNK